jgi:hypothetical protein
MIARCLATLALLALSGPVHAAFVSGLINVDFQIAFPLATNMFGAGLTGAAGDQWNIVNSLSGPFNVAAILSDGSASAGVTITGSANGAAASVISGFSGTLFDPLMRDQIMPASPMTISGLSAGFAYELIIYSQNALSGSGTSTFAINGDARTAASNPADSTFVENKNYVHFASTTADAGGNLVLNLGGSFDFGAGNQGVINGLQIRALGAPGGGGGGPAVPLPAAVWLGTALGGVVVARRQRRAR